MEQNIESIVIPRVVIHVEKVGHNSLLGALSAKFIKDGHIKHLEYLQPTEIVFVIKEVLPEVDLYKEINNVRDVMLVDEKKIKVFVSDDI